MKFCWICIFIIWSGAMNSFAQDSITPASGRVFSKGELRRLIQESAYQVAKEYRVPREIFDERYKNLEKSFLVNVRPVLKQKFKWVESTGGRDNRSLYEKEIYRGVRDVLLNDPVYMTLAAMDQTDRIISFKSDIDIRKDGLLVVTEYIRIYNGDGEQSSMYLQLNPNGDRIVSNDIQRGITRDFPTLYATEQGLNATVPFEVVKVYRNGSPEKYNMVEHDNGVTIRIGSADEFIPEGVHLYMIQYETSSQIIFHEGKDELYWNVNGNGSVFTVDTVQCRITFPAGAKIFENACYTGAQGSSARDCSSKIVRDNSIEFITNKQLWPNEGLTIAASIQKGVLDPPSKVARYAMLARANWPIPVMLVVVLGLFGINFRNWRKHGKDPSKGTIIPQFDPPAGISPADAGFIYKQKYKPEQFSAALVDIAVRKGIRILIGEEGVIFKSKIYSFVRGEKAGTVEGYVSRSYGWSIGALDNLTASKKYNSRIADLDSELDSHLNSQFRSDSAGYKGKRGFFKWNSGAGGWGFFFLGILAFAAILLSKQIHTLTVGGIVGAIIALWIVMKIVFYNIMPAYNEAGRKVLDHILGLRMYLATAEERRFDKLQPPEKNLELFEKFLPYAIALECQNEWADKFETILTEAIEGGNYQPSYYSGSSRNWSSMSSDLSSGLSYTISSASTEPSSSGSSGGGSSGGGFSGGGGGGGGVGGW